MKAYEGSSYIAPPTLILVLGGGDWSSSSSGCFISINNPGVHSVGGWVGPRAHLDFSGIQSLYRTGHNLVTVLKELLLIV